MKLKTSYYRQNDTLHLARDLLGKVLCTQLDGHYTSAIITETEAYLGVEDRACHAWNGRRTARTETMFQSGGVAYVYLCYGIHNLLNIVTNKKDVPHAILIRAVYPLEGLDIIHQRRGGPKTTVGPGTVTQALGIDTSHDGLSLVSDIIWIEDRSVKVAEHDIIIGPRVGVDYAGEHAKLPYRFRFRYDNAIERPLPQQRRKQK